MHNLRNGKWWHRGGRGGSKREKEEGPLGSVRKVGKTVVSDEDSRPS